MGLIFMAMWLVEESIGFERMMEIQRAAATEFLSTHPAEENKIRRLRSYCRRPGNIRNQSKRDDLGFEFF